MLTPKTLSWDDAAWVAQPSSQMSFSLRIFSFEETEQMQTGVLLCCNGCG